MRKPCAAMILSLLLALFWFGFLAGQPRAAQPSPAVKWEYNVVTDTRENIGQLRDAGKQGWEAYAVTVDLSNTKYYYLKRQTQ